jgi:enoyl-CoA hydratase/carnithine racemase
LIASKNSRTLCFRRRRDRTEPPCRGVDDGAGSKQLATRSRPRYDTIDTERSSGMRPMTEQPVYLRIDGAIAQLVLNRPEKRNALRGSMWTAIPELVAEAAGHEDVKVLILRGTPGAFCAGADIAEFEEVFASREAARAYHGVVHAAYDAIASLPIPTIALVQGVCFGGGCALALCCDLRYADESASFCIPPARLGLAYSLAETKRLVDLVGPAKAKEMLMGARVIAVDEALRIGLVTRLFPASELEHETLGFARRLSGLSQFTITATKQVVAAIMNGAIEETARTRELFDAQFDSPDYVEGRRAFLEKREPDFTRR